MRDSVCLSCARARVVVFRGRCSSCAALVARCAAAAQPAREPNPGVLLRHGIIDNDLFEVLECHDPSLRTKAFVSLVGMSGGVGASPPGAGLPPGGGGGPYPAICGARARSVSAFCAVTSQKV